MPQSHSRTQFSYYSKNKITPSASFYARPGHAVRNANCSPATVSDHVPSAATRNLRTSAELLQAELLQAELQRLALRSSSTSPGLVANPYTLFPDSDSKKCEEPIVYRNMARTRGLNYGSPYYTYGDSSNANTSYSYRNHGDLESPYGFNQNSTNVGNVGYGTNNSFSPNSTNVGNVGYGNGGFSPNSTNAGNLGYSYGGSYNMYQGYQPTSPYGFSQNSTNVGNVGYGNGGFSPNSTNVGNLGYGYGGSYNMYQGYQSASPYGGAISGGPYFNRGANMTEQANEESDHTTVLLEFMTSRAARIELERHNYDDDLVCNLVRSLSRDREVLATAAEDVDGVEFLMVLFDVVRPCRYLCKCFVSALEPKASELMMHPTSCKLVLHCITELNNGQNKPCLQSLLAEATKSCLKLARSEHGKVFLEECIKHLGYPHNCRIVDRLVEHSASLAKHSKGNYVVQAVLQLGVPQFSRSVCRALKGRLEEVSMDQHGSYVIQRALASAGGKILLEELASLEEDRLETLATDRYGNYILQTAVKESKKQKHDELHDALVSAIKRLPEELEDHVYASKVMRVIQS